MLPSACKPPPSVDEEYCAECVGSIVCTRSISSPFRTALSAVGMAAKASETAFNSSAFHAASPSLTDFAPYVVTMADLALSSGVAGGAGPPGPLPPGLACAYTAGFTAKTLRHQSSWASGEDMDAQFPRRSAYWSLNRNIRHGGATCRVESRAHGNDRTSGSARGGLKPSGGNPPNPDVAEVLGAKAAAWVGAGDLPAASAGCERPKSGGAFVRMSR